MPLGHFVSTDDDLRDAMGIVGVGLVDLEGHRLPCVDADDWLVRMFTRAVDDVRRTTKIEFDRERVNELCQSSAADP